MIADGCYASATYGLDFGAEDSPPISKLYGDIKNTEVKQNDERNKAGNHSEVRSS